MCFPVRRWLRWAGCWYACSAAASARQDSAVEANVTPRRDGILSVNDEEYKRSLEAFNARGDDHAASQRGSLQAMEEANASPSEDVSPS
jgi:hypothetical protein